MRSVCHYSVYGVQGDCHYIITNSVYGVQGDCHYIITNSVYGIQGDCRYIITNSKDQTIKLWDLRKFSRQEAVDATLCRASRQSWDYRWESVPVKSQKESLMHLPGDTSVMTYAGHLVKHTLLRCRFSPRATTGQVRKGYHSLWTVQCMHVCACLQHYIYTACVCVSAALHLHCLC